MGTDEDPGELQARISNLSDEELLNMVEVEPDEYRKKALDYARAELMERGIQFQEAREPTDDGTDSTTIELKAMKRLISCKDIAEAGLLKGLLAEAGIDCEIRGENLSMAAGLLPFIECYPELWVVGDEDLERAQAIIEEWQSEEDEAPASWECKECGEENEGQFDACWKCGKEKPNGKDQESA